MVSIRGHSFNTGPYGKSESKMAIISGHFIMQTCVGYLCQVSDTGLVYFPNFHFFYMLQSIHACHFEILSQMNFSKG